MAAGHLPINGGQHRGVTAGIHMVKLVSGILRHNHWGWGHVVEIGKPPNLLFLLTSDTEEFGH